MGGDTSIALGLKGVISFTAMTWVMKGGKRKSLGISWCPFATITIAVLCWALTAHSDPKFRISFGILWENPNASKNEVAQKSSKHYVYQGSSARLVLPAILGKQRGWCEIQNLYMRFVILKVRNPLLCTVSRGPLYIIVHLPGSWN